MSDIVMLAAPSKDIAPTPLDAFIELRSRGWVFEPKFDGVRCLLRTNEHGQVTLINRNQRDITFRYPEVVERFGRVPPGHTLDGELVVLDDDNIPDFRRLSTRDRMENPPSAADVSSTPVDFIPFDLIEVLGMPTHGGHFIERTQLLHFLCQQMGFIHHMPRSDEEIFEEARAMGYEGVMAKDPKSTYVPGRSTRWVKLKFVTRGTFIVREYEPSGSGSFEGLLGAMHLDVLHQGELQRVGKVGTGFTEEQRRSYGERLDRGERLIVEVEFAEYTDGGRLRFPSFKGERTDVGPDSCVFSQLT